MSEPAPQQPTGGGDTPGASLSAGAPSWLQNIVDVGITVAGLHRRHVVDAHVQRMLVEHVQQIWDFVLKDWTRFLLDHCNAKRYVRPHSSLAKLYAELQTAEAAFKADTPSLLDPQQRPEGYYDAMTGTLERLADAGVRAYTVGLGSFAVGLEQDAAEALAVFGTLHKAASRIAIVEAYEVAAPVWTYLADQLRYVSLQPSTPSDVKQSLQDNLGLLAELTRDVSEQINGLVVTIVGSEQDKACMEGLSDKVLPALELLLHGIQQLSRDYTAFVKAHKLDNVYRDKLAQAASYAKNLDDLLQGELDNIKKTGAESMLRQYTLMTGKAPSESMAAVAQGTDVVDCAVENILIALATEESVYKLPDAVSSIKPVLAKLPSSLRVLIQEETNEISQASIFVAEFINEAIKTLRYVNSQCNAAMGSVSSLSAVQASAGNEEGYVELLNKYKDVLAQCASQLKVERSVHLFATDTAESLRADIRRRLAAPEPEQSRRRAWLGVQCDSLGSMLQSFLDSHVVKASEVNKALAEQIAHKLTETVTTTSASLVSQTDALMSAKGHEASGAAQQLATLCADASNLTDVTRNLMPVFSDVDSSSSVEPESPTTKAETEPADPDEIPALDSVRKVFDTLATPSLTSLLRKMRPRSSSTATRVPQPEKLKAVAADADGQSVKSQQSSRKGVLKLLAESIAITRPSPRSSLDADRSSVLTESSSTSFGASRLNKRVRELSESSSVAESLYMQADGKPQEEDEERGVGGSEADEKVLGENIWNERGTATLTGGDQHGSINQLVVHLTSPSGSGEDGATVTDFVRTFIVSMHLFTSPTVFVKKMQQRFDVPVCPAGQDVRTYDLAIRAPTKIRVCNVLKRYVLTRAEQDLPCSMALETTFMNFLNGPIAKESSFLASNLRRCFDMCRSADRYEKMKQFFREGVDFTDPLSIDAPATDRHVPFYKMLRQFNAREVAQQLTLIDAELFRLVRLKDLSSLNWEVESDHLSPPSNASRSVFQWIFHSTRVSSWVAACILQQETVHARAKVYGKFIELANELKVLGNYHGSAIVVAGLTSGAIDRLKWMKQDTSVRAVKMLEQLVADGATLSSIASYRNLASPKVPFMPVLLRETLSIETASRVLTSDGNVNWNHCTSMTGPLAFFLDAQHHAAFDFKPNKSLQALLLESIGQLFTLPSVLFELSISREPLEGVPEDKLRKPTLVEVMERLKDRFI